MTAGPIRLSEGAHTALRPATAARITGGFWAARRRVNAEMSIAQGPRRLKEAGSLDHLRAAAGAKAPGFTGDVQVQDSDVHKWLKAASWQLADGAAGAAETAGAAGRELARQVGRLIELVAAAQDTDGYLQTHYQVGPGAQRWSDLH